MVDLLHLASVETLTWKPPLPPAPTPPQPAAEICAVGMVVQWAGMPAKPVPTKQSADYLVAMHELVRRIAQLKTQASTAEPAEAAVLLPQLRPEVEAVIQAQTVWRTSLLSNPASLAPRADSLANCSSQPGPSFNQEWQVCVAQWLWWIAQSSHEALRLLEGCPAQIITLEGEQPGRLRLVVGLMLSPNSQSAPQAPAASDLAFDLVTGEALPPLLPAAQRLQVPDSLLSQPMAAGAFLQRLTDQLLEAVPTLRSCFEGLSARWLIPLQPWQTGSLRLSLGLAFSPIALASDPPVSDPPVSGLSVSDQSANLQGPDQPDQPVEPVAGSNPGSDFDETSLPQISFSQADWLEQHISIAVAQQLTQLFLQQPPTNDRPETVLAQGCNLIDQLQDSFTLASRIFAQQSLLLNELALRLQWGINRTAYEVMQLTSGLGARLLQPQQPWQTGRLRLVIWLTVQTSEQQWRFDVAERCVCPTPEISDSKTPIPGETLIRTDEHDWCLRPVTLAQLEAAFWQQIEQAAPEIALLRADTEVMVATDHSQGGLGGLRLETAFEFWPDPVSSRFLSW